MSGLDLFGVDHPAVAPVAVVVPSSANPWLSAALGAMLGAFVFQPLAQGAVALARGRLGGGR